MRAFCLVIILLAVVTPAAGFLDQILNQMNGQQRGGHPAVEFKGFPKGNATTSSLSCRFNYLPDALPRSIAGTSEKIGKKYEFLKNTKWDWNKWNKVVFEADGNFHAPTEECEGGGCRWSANKGMIYIVWGDAGLHTLKASALQAEPGTTLDGERTSDGDKCTAEFVGKVNPKKTRQHRQQQQKALPGAEEEEEEEEDDVDLYADLGLDEEATEREIKKAFRKLSVKYHPDKNRGNEEALKKYRTIAEAHEVLGNPDKKILYDTGGMKMVTEAAKEDAGGGRQDPFAAFFGGGRKKGPSHKGQDYRMEMKVSLEDIYNGKEVTFQIRRRVVCRGCKKRKVKGKDGKKVQKVLPKRCTDCKDRCPDEIKTVLKPHPQMGGMMVQQQERVKSKEYCNEEDTKLTHVVEKGMPPGAELKFDRMSEQKPGEIPGDVIVTLKQKDHDRFERKGNHLHTQLKISLREALLGFERVIPHLDGRPVPIGRKQISSPFDVLKLQGQGMPVHEAPSEFGDLFVELLVQVPTVGGDGGKKTRGPGEGGVLTEDERQELGRILTPGFVLGEAEKERIKKEKERLELEEQEEEKRQQREAMEQMKKEREAVQAAMDAQAEGIGGMRFDDDAGGEEEEVEEDYD
jgi:DnaJ-class molecular chaperone